MCLICFIDLGLVLRLNSKNYLLSLMTGLGHADIVGPELGRFTITGDCGTEGLILYCWFIFCSGIRA